MARTLIEAIQRSDVALAKKIIQAKNYTCIDCQTAKRRGTGLFWACCRGLLEIAQLLIARKANVNATTAWGSTPLHAAADSNNCEIIKLLLKHGADVNAKTETGDTPCHLAAYRGHAHAVQILVEGGADIGITNNRFRLPVHEAEQQSHLELVHYLQAVALLGRETNDWSKQNHPYHNNNKKCAIHLEDRKCLTCNARDGVDIELDDGGSRVEVPERQCDAAVDDDDDRFLVDSDAASYLKNDLFPVGASNALFLTETMSNRVRSRDEDSSGVFRLKADAVYWTNALSGRVSDLSSRVSDLSDRPQSTYTLSDSYFESNDLSLGSGNNSSRWTHTNIPI